MTKRFANNCASTSVNYQLLAACVGCGLFLVFSIRTGSIWIDEGQTFAVVHETWANMFHAVLWRKNAVSGMPLYFILEFFWCNLFGYSELALRSMNCLCALLLLLGSCKLIATMKLPAWTLFLFTCHPIFVYYMNEARPYAALYACGMWCLAILAEYAVSARRRGLVAFMLVFSVGVALHLMFVFMWIAYAFLALWHWYHHRLKVRDHLLAHLYACPLLFPLAVHYLRLLLTATEVHAEHPQPVASLFQIGYYFAGLGGLGWSRNDLRAMQLFFSPRICISMVLLLLSLLTILALACKRKWLQDAQLVLVGVCTVGAFGAFLVANLTLRTRFWERHVIFLLPGTLLGFSLLCKNILQPSATGLAHAAVFTLLAMLALSSVNLMVLPYYQKDNYRGAVERALACRPDHILFQGDGLTFGYYGVSAPHAFDLLQSNDPIAGHADISQADEHVIKELLARLSGKVVLILSEKRDFDAAGLYSRLAPQGVRINSFAIVELPSGANDLRLR